MILDSYAMITPDGRCYQDTKNLHHYNDPILKIGLINASKQINFNKMKYNNRKGNYFIK